MKYKDYRNAARKHLNTCTVLEEKYNTNSCTTETRKSLVLNMYYLSGYIIECIVKYGIYDLIGYDKDQDVKLLDNGKLTYQNNIRHHQFERYTEHLVRYISRPIPLISATNGIDRDVIRLYSDWDAEVRYSYDLGIINERHYLDFFVHSKSIFKIVTDNTRG